MNKEDLKNKIETFYIKSLNIDNPDFLITLDAVKSIIGINLDHIKINLLDWFANTIKDVELNEYRPNNFEDVPGAISFYSLEAALLDNNKKKSYESIFYLSKVSEGTQIFEFLLEFSLKHTGDCFRYIWHIMRLDRFFNGKYRIESLNYLNSKTNNVLLYYIIYNSKLIRSDCIRRLISVKLETSSMQRYPEDAINIKKEQILNGKLWINSYFDKLKIEDISLDEIILFDQIRSCLLFDRKHVDVELFWVYLNRKLCN